MLIIGIAVFWLFYISVNCVYLHRKGFTAIDAGVHAWGIFFIAHAFYELPYMFYYTFFTHHRVIPSPIALYLSISGLIFMFWLRGHYSKDTTELFRWGIPVQIALSSLIIIFACLVGVDILSEDYGLSGFCWASRLIAVIYTWSIPYNLGEFKTIEVVNPAKL